MNQIAAKIKTRIGTGDHGALLAGGSLLFVSTTLVNAGNYVFNLILGRWLGPVAFADLSLVVTLLLVLSFATTTLSLVAARFTATHEAEGSEFGIATLRRWLVTRAWIAGIVIGLALIVGAPQLRTFFQTQSSLPFVILGAGIPFFIVQGVDRGVLQGRTRFGTLSLSYQAEMWVRLLGGVALVGAGLSVNWAVGAISASFVATYLVARRAGAGLPKPGALPHAEKAKVAAFAGPVIAGLFGQILINNSDVMIVKHFFDAEQAGQYAALALVGRAVFFATWSIVTVTFPVVAQKHAKGEPHAHLLWISVGIVLGISGTIAAAMAIAPKLIVRLLFGAEYLPIASLLWLYAISTMLYALANVAINYQLSTGRGTGSWFALGAGAAQVIALWLFHDTLKMAVLVQIGIMASLAIAAFGWTIGTMPSVARERQPMKSKKQKLAA